MSFNVTPQDDAAENGFGADPVKLEQLLNARRAAESLPLAILGGLTASVIAAILWATITYATGYQIGFMAIGVGFLVGYAVNFLGKGMSMPFSIVGALFALLGCLLGNLFATIISASMEDGSSVGSVLLVVVTNPGVVIEVMTSTFSPIDLLFYAIAIYEGYKLSVRPLTDEEISSVQKTIPPPPAASEAVQP